MAKEDKSKLIIWAVVALVIGVILGLVITNMTATGKAKSALGLDSRQEANLQEARQDLVLRNLQVSNILANTAYDQQINVSSYLKANSGVYANELLVGNDGLRVKNIYSSDNDNPSINFLSGVKSQKGFYLGMYGSSNAFIVSPNTGNPGNGNSTITIKAPTKIDAPFATYSSAKFGKIGTTDENSAAALEVYQSNPTFATVKVNAPILFNELAGTGNAYACLSPVGKLFRSQTPCN